MIDYVMPSGVRIADGARVRLGAYLGSGTTVMHEGFINFNAGTEGPNMVEGRISAGVFVGGGSDLGGGCSTMGTLSGGNRTVISVGKNCLIGANAGLGISLGDDCTIEAGLYVTAGSKVKVFDKDKKLRGTTKAVELSGRGEDVPEGQGAAHGAVHGNLGAAFRIHQLEALDAVVERRLARGDGRPDDRREHGVDRLELARRAFLDEAVEVGHEAHLPQVIDRRPLACVDADHGQ